MKRECIDWRFVKKFWSNLVHCWAELPAVGTSGDIVILWDPNRVDVTEVLRDEFSLSIKCKGKNSHIRWAFFYFYGPVSPNLINSFWEEIETENQRWNLP